MLESVLNMWTIRGYSVVAVAIVLAIIAAWCALVCGVAAWINPRLLVLAVPLVVFDATRIWREMK